MKEKGVSKALDFVTKDDADAEIETGLLSASEVVQTLHDTNFKVDNIELKTIPAVVPALGDVTGRVIIKAHKIKGRNKS